MQWKNVCVVFINQSKLDHCFMTESAQTIVLCKLLSKLTLMTLPQGSGNNFILLFSEKNQPRVHCLRLMHWEPPSLVSCVKRVALIPFLYVTLESEKLMTGPIGLLSLNSHYNSQRASEKVHFWAPNTYSIAFECWSSLKIPFNYTVL